MDKQAQDASLMRDLNGGETPLFSQKVIITLIIVLILGLGSGYVLSLSKGKPSVTNVSSSGKVSSTGKGTVVGSDDTKTFKDSAEGTLKEGGIEGEGQYHLVRPGGDDQNVYLTSSIVDLSQFVGKKIKVWGQTQAAQQAGWLMDVGRVEVL